MEEGLRLDWGSLNFRMPPGEKWWLVEEHEGRGAELCRLLAGLRVREEACVTLDGKPLPIPDGTVPAAVGYLPAPVPALAGAPRVESAIATRLGIEWLLERPGPYSVGENQLLQLAATLSLPHRYLVLERPLDPLGGADFNRALAAVAASPTGVLVTAAVPPPATAAWRRLTLPDD